MAFVKAFLLSATTRFILGCAVNNTDNSLLQVDTQGPHISHRGCFCPGLTDSSSWLAKYLTICHITCSGEYCSGILLVLPLLE